MSDVRTVKGLRFAERCGIRPSGVAMVVVELLAALQDLTLSQRNVDCGLLHGDCRLHIVTGMQSPLAPVPNIGDRVRSIPFGVTGTVTYSREYCKAQLGFCDMLTPDGYNPKTKKGRARGYATAILHLAPHKLSGANLCPDASAGCIAGCLNLAGHGGINLDALGLNAVQRARIARSVAMRKNRFAFKAILTRAIGAHIRRALRKGLIPVVRLNGTSDVPWEHYKLNDGRTVFETFPTIQFYDYTKSVARALANARGEHPANYHLTFSRSETNELDCERVLNAGGNVAIVANICSCKRACKHEFPDGLRS